MQYSNINNIHCFYLQASLKIRNNKKTGLTKWYIHNKIIPFKLVHFALDFNLTTTFISSIRNQLSKANLLTITLTVLQAS